jgi:hypothetical protein
MHIEECFLHVLDYLNGTRVYSQIPMKLDADIEEYVISHIDHFFSGYDVSTLPVNTQMPIWKMMENSRDQGFSALSLEVADAFYGEMTKSEDIKPCDLICARIDLDGKEYFAFIKLNFKTSYVHLIETEEESISNKIVRHVSTLPQKTQSADEGFVLDWMDEKVLVKDKLVTIDGKKTKYISNVFLGGSESLTPKKAVDVMTKTAEKIMNKYQSEGLVHQAKVRNAIHELIDENGSLDPAQIASACFDSHEERTAYQEAISEKGLMDTAWEIAETHKKKLKRTQKIKTASGVEIILPYEYAAKDDNLEISTKPDGSVEIQLKNLGELI